MITFSKSTFLTVILMGVMMLTACAPAGPNLAQGMVEPLHYGTTWLIIQKAISGAQGTKILMDQTGSAYILTKTLQDGIGFVILQPKAAAGAVNPTYITDITGQLASATDMKGLEEFLKEKGWRVVGAKELPLWLQALGTVVANSAKQAIQAAAYGLTTILVMPAGVLVNPPGVETIDG